MRRRDWVAVGFFSAGVLAHAGSVALLEGSAIATAIWWALSLYAYVWACVRLDRELSETSSAK